MAVNTATNVTQRRVLYGANAIIQTALVLAVVGGVVYFAQHYKQQVDLTHSGVNSLSPRTTQLLERLPEDITITAIYTVLSKYDERAQKRWDRVQDLLALYESAGHGRITANMIDPMKDRAQLPALLKRLAEKPAYKDQAKAHAAALAEFPELNAKIIALADSQAAEGEQLLESEPALARLPFGTIVQQLGAVRRLATETNTQLQELQAYEIPRYSQAIDEMRAYLDKVVVFFAGVQEWVATNVDTTEGITDSARAYLNKVSDDYTGLLASMNGLLERTESLEQVELEELSNGLDRWASAPPILVENAQKAELLSFTDVWPLNLEQAGRSPDGDEHEFAGEQVVSSAILKLTQKEKTAVVFTRWGGPSPIVPDFSQMQAMNMRQMPRAPYGVLNDLLGKENFVTADWDVQTEKTPPPAEGTVRTIYVVFPPRPPEQPDPRRPAPEGGITPDDVRIVTDAVDASGMALFLATATPSTSPIPDVSDSKYEYGSYLASRWGIDVEYEFLTVPFTPMPDDPNAYTYTGRRGPPIVGGGMLEFTDHAIGEPLQAVPGGFDGACPLRARSGDGMPAGVKVEPVVEVKNSDDVWAVSNLARVSEELQKPTGTHRHEDDLAPPFAVALAAERAAATDTEAAAEKAGNAQRLVVFGSASFVSDGMLEMPGGFGFSGGGVVTYAAFPANRDLFINALHWLTHDADRISVSPQDSDVPRLTRLKDDAMYAFWQVFLVALWPALVLVVGLGVGLYRRR